MGDWLALLRAVDDALQRGNFQFLTPPVNTFFREGSIYNASEAIAPMAEMDLPAKVRISYFMDLIVQFRNKKFGHGSISEGEATRVTGLLEAGLVEWLSGLLVLQECRLVYIHHVEWTGENFVYLGHDINNGTSIYPLNLKGIIPATPKRIYLTRKDENSNLTLLPLYPFFAYNKDYTLLYALNGMSIKGYPILRCFYAHSIDLYSLTLEVERASVLGESLVDQEAGIVP